MDIKQNVVQEDFHEKNIRKTLNFGHTIGHAVESLCLSQGNPILHGEAVAMGMITEAHLAYLEGLISEEDSKLLSKIFRDIILTLISAILKMKIF
jgi:3-dehydroquinate synthase